jgi:hypothetical protein
MRSVSEYLWRAQRADVEIRLELGHCRRVDHSSRPQRPVCCRLLPAAGGPAAVDMKDLAGDER